jgi:hypothetical protein
MVATRSTHAIEQYHRLSTVTPVLRASHDAL